MRLAALTNGAASGTTVRAYLAGKNVTATRLIAIARVLGELDGGEVLRAYGLHEAAEALHEDALAPMPPPPIQAEARRATRTSAAEALASMAAYLASLEARLDALEQRHRHE